MMLLEDRAVRKKRRRAPPLNYNATSVWNAGFIRQTDERHVSLPDESVTMQLGCRKSSGDAPSPQGESDAFVASIHHTRRLVFAGPATRASPPLPSDAASLLPRRRQHQDAPQPKGRGAFPRPDENKLICCRPTRPFSLSFRSSEPWVPFQLFQPLRARASRLWV
jgi:hypothetical protein